LSLFRPDRFRHHIAFLFLGQLLYPCEILSTYTKLRIIKNALDPRVLRHQLHVMLELLLRVPIRARIELLTSGFSPEMILISNSRQDGRAFAKTFGQRLEQEVGIRFCR
jgi:hypothetical protein